MESLWYGSVIFRTEVSHGEQREVRWLSGQFGVERSHCESRTERYRRHTTYYYHRRDQSNIRSRTAVARQQNKSEYLIPVVENHECGRLDIKNERDPKKREWDRGVDGCVRGLEGGIIGRTQRRAHRTRESVGREKRIPSCYNISYNDGRV